MMLFRGSRQVKDIPHWINGNPVYRKENLRPVFNPSTGEQHASLSMAGPDLLNEAVMAAQQAFPAWSQTPLPKRARALFRLRTLLDTHREALAQLISKEHGKLLGEALASVDRGLEVVSFACGISDHLLGDFAA